MNPIKPIVTLAGVAVVCGIAAHAAASVQVSVDANTNGSLPGVTGQLMIIARNSQGGVTDQGIYTATLAAGTAVRLTANYIAGNGSPFSASIIGLNNSGQQIPNCNATDNSVNGTAVSTTCTGGPPTRYNIIVD